MPLYLPSFDEIMAVAETRGDASEAPHLWRGLVGAWPLQEPGGVTAFDVSGKRNLTLTSMDLSTAHAVSTMGRAINLDGSNDLLVGPANSGMYGAAGLTVSAWLNFRTIGGTESDYIVSYATDATTYAWIFFAYDNTADNIAFQAGTTLYRIAANGTARTGWHHVCATYDGGAVATGIKIYVDATEASYASGQNGARNADSAAHAIRFGNRADAARPLDGLLGPLSIYSRALAPAEIQQLYADPWAMYRMRAIVHPVAASAGGDITETASPVSATWSVVAPATAKTIAPAAVAATWSLIAPATSKTVAVSPVSASWSIPTPLAGSSFIAVDVDSVSAQWSVAAPATAKTTTPDPVSATWTPAAPTTAKTLAVDPVAMTWSIVAAELLKTTTPDPVAAAWLLPDVTTAGGAGTAVAVNPVVATWTVAVARGGTKPVLDSANVLRVQSESRVLRVQSESRVLRVR